MTSSLDIIAFPGTSLLAHFVGLQKGIFARHGVEANLTPTPSSVYQITNLVSGKFQIANTAFDNIVAYQEGQGAVTLDREPDMFVFMAASQVELPFIVAADIASYADLEGRTIAVDALSTGFAFVLRRMLDRGGLTPDDYTLVSVGGTKERWESLEAGEHAGSLLNDPFRNFALDAGFRQLETSLDVLDHYQSGTYAACRSWAEENKIRLVAFIRAYLEALEWTLDPANLNQVIDILARRMPDMMPQAVAAAVAEQMKPETGLTPGAVLDMAGIDTVLELRSQYGEPKKALTDPGKYIDLS